MTITTQDHMPVRQRAAALGCTLPDGLVILPSDFETATAGDGLRFPGEASTMRKLLHAAGIKADRLSSEAPPLFVHNRNFDLAIPAIFIGTELLKQNPDIVSVLMDVVRDHAKELFGPTGRKRTISAEIVVEDRRSGRCTKVKYEGDADGLKEVTKLVRGMRR